MMVDLKLILFQQLKYKRVMQVQSYTLFVDNSGSVGGSENYWSTVSHIITQYGADINDVYLWNSTAGLITKKILQNSILTRKGTGGTNPENVAQVIVQNKYQRIILVTDGQVGDYNVQKCDKIFQTGKQNGFSLVKSICYIISTGSSQVNMSVTCPFTRYCQSQVFTRRKGEALKQQIKYTPEDFKILDSLEQITLENFEAKYDTIEGLIIALNMGKEGNIPLKNQLVLTKKRLVKELSKKMNIDSDYSQMIRKRLLDNDFAEAIQIAKNLSKNYFGNSITMDLQKKISHLINLCGDLRGKYSIGEIKSNKMATADTAKQGQIDQSIQVQDLSSFPIECPIIMDEDVPQILIDECEPFLLGIEKNIIDDIAACPLRILNYPEIRAKFKARLSTYTGVKYSDKFQKNPFTQNRLLGAIPLGTHKSHITVGNYTIAKMITGGKILGNLHMYYAVIWYLIHEGEIEFLKDIEKNATEHLLYRLKTSITTASMCGLSQFVTTELNTDIAIWYCVNSGYLNQPTDRDTFRFHFYNLEPMIKITKVLGYPNDKNLKIHYLRTKAFLNLLNKFKRMKHPQRLAYKTLFKGLYQRGVFVDIKELSPRFRELEVCPQFIPLDGPASIDQIQQIKMKLPKYCQQMNSEDIYYISTLLDAQKSASDVFLDYHMVASQLPQPKVEWVYGLQAQIPTVIKINPKTVRPYYRIEGENWDDIAKRHFKADNIKQLFSGCKLYQMFFQKYKKIPKFEELIIFFYNRLVESGKKSTLPYLCKEWTYQLLEEYSVIYTENWNIETILKQINEFQSIAKRIEIQN